MIKLFNSNESTSGIVTHIAPFRSRYRIIIAFRCWAVPSLQKHISRDLEDVNIYMLWTCVGVIKQEPWENTFALRFRLHVFYLSWGSREEPRSGKISLIPWVESQALEGCMSFSSYLSRFSKRWIVSLACCLHGCLCARTRRHITT